MAKKKSNPQSQSQEDNSKVAKTVEEAPAAMAEDGEKVNPKKEIASLKSLNAMLLKETVERRHQVDSLLASKGSLESELSRSEEEKKVLKEELERLSDGAAMLEIERGLVAEFVSVQEKQQAVAVAEIREIWENLL